MTIIKKNVLTVFMIDKTSHLGDFHNPARHDEL
jgi:hypothetical protein